jgi:NTE family protein
MAVARSAVGRLETVDLAKYFFPPSEDGVLFRSPAPPKKPAIKRGASAKRAK